MSLVTIERQKYERAWSDPVYRVACHSLALWQQRPDLFPEVFSSALDIGCGTGRLMALWNEQGIDAWGIDIADNALDPVVQREWGEKFVHGCLWDQLDMSWGHVFDFGICTDVMEHIPPERVLDTLRCIGSGCAEVLFKIAHSPNQLGEETLHLTLEPHEWWEKQMRAIGGYAEYLGVQMRSGCQDSLVRWTP